ncbi:MAG TPA: carbohydrate kinase family protein [Lachnospiraceae bacterium]|nr:carbohydrate kinase family protein [Lachnospiraceae bacterium]
MNKKAIIAGHICVDITPVFPNNTKNDIRELLQPGKLIHVGKADVHTGGAVANTGLAMKFLGADTMLMGKVGDDAFGHMVLDILKEHGAAEHMLISPELSTSYSVVLAVPGIDRIFLHNPGANDSFRSEDIPEKMLEEAALFHFGYPPIMRSMYENDGEELLKIMMRAKKAGTATSLDMAAIDPDSDAGHADWEKILARVLPYVDFFVPSAEELCFMLDRERYLSWQARAEGRDMMETLDIEKDIKPLADRCLDLGAKIIVIKCGKPGMYYRTAGKEDLAGIGSKAGLNPLVWSDQEGFEKSYIPEKVLSGTGAGDTSIAAFLTAMLEGCPPKECLQLSAATGACCVTSYDALSGLKSFDFLRNKIRQGWKKNE